MEIVSVLQGKNVRTNSLKIAFPDVTLNPEKPGRSGLSDLVWDTASGLIDMGIEVHVIGAYKTSKFPDSRVHVHNVRVPMAYRNLLGRYFLIKTVYNTVKAINPDITHSFEYDSTALFSYFGYRNPMVLTVPGNIYQRLSLKSGSSYEWHYAQFLKWAAKRSARDCSMVIAISREMEKWWSKIGVADSRLITIPLYYNQNRFHFTNNAHQFLGVDPSVPLILFVGRFTYEKGVLELLEAIKMLSIMRSNRPWRLVMIGTGPLHEKMVKSIVSAQLENRIQILNWVEQDNLKYWYSAATATVLPSYTEGLSRVILESMACGTPIIGTRASGTEDHIVNKVNGSLVEIGDIQALTAAILDVIDNPEMFAVMRKATLDYAERTFGREILLNRLVNEVY